MVFAAAPFVTFSSEWSLQSSCKKWLYLLRDIYFFSTIALHLLFFLLVSLVIGRFLPSISPILTIVRISLLSTNFCMVSPEEKWNDDEEEVEGGINCCFAKVCFLNIRIIKFILTLWSKFRYSELYNNCSPVHKQCNRWSHRWLNRVTCVVVYAGVVVIIIRCEGIPPHPKYIFIGVVPSQQTFLNQLIVTAQPPPSFLQSILSNNLFDYTIVCNPAGCNHSLYLLSINKLKSLWAPFNQ